VRIFQYQPEKHWETSFLTLESIRSGDSPAELVIRGFCNYHGYVEQLRNGRCFTKLKPTHPEYLDGDCYRIVTKNRGIVYIKIEFFQSITLTQLTNL
jgi:hypothetical protein